MFVIEINLPYYRKIQRDGFYQGKTEGFARVRLKPNWDTLHEFSWRDWKNREEPEDSV